MNTCCLFASGSGFSDTVLMHHRLVEHLAEKKPLHRHKGFPRPAGSFCIAIVFRNLQKSDEFEFLYHTILPKRLKLGTSQVFEFCLAWHIKYNNYLRLDTASISKDTERMYDLDNILIKSCRI